MSKLHGRKKVAFNEAVAKAWKAVDTAFLVDFRHNSVSVYAHGCWREYQFKNGSIMDRTESILDGVEKYAPEIKCVAFGCSIYIVGKETGVDQVVQSLGCKDWVKPIIETPYMELLKNVD